MAVLRAFRRTFAIYGLRASYDNFLHRQVLIANDLQHLRCPKLLTRTYFAISGM